VRPPYAPMKAVLADETFSHPDWIFERKLDGVRCLAHRDRSGVRLLSRTDRDMTPQYPELAEALEGQPGTDFVVDGEVVALDSRGISRFGRLQRRGRERVPVFLYLFDILRHEGEDLRDLPLRRRKAILRRSLHFRDPLRLTPHVNEHGEEQFEQACRKGLEGIIAKRADSAYHASRSRDWLKLKCHAEQELVIGGFTLPQGSRTDFGALLVGYYEGGSPRYAGKVGTGFGRSTLAQLGAELRRRETEENPFSDVHPVPRGTRWVEPELVAQIGFAEWTRDGRLRHPRYIGLRDDKPAREVVRERPV
jgi:bifunctional non-homologous end joining protein LigD